MCPPFILVAIQTAHGLWIFLLIFFDNKTARLLFAFFLPAIRPALSSLLPEPCFGVVSNEEPPS